MPGTQASDNFRAKRHSPYSLSVWAPAGVDRLPQRRRHRSNHNVNTVHPATHPSSGKDVKSICPYCGLICPKNLKRHIRTKHWEAEGIPKPIFLCESCGKTFIRSDALKRHLDNPSFWQCKQAFECFSQSSGPIDPTKVGSTPTSSHPPIHRNPMDTFFRKSQSNEGSASSTWQYDCLSTPDSSLSSPAGSSIQSDHYITQWSDNDHTFACSQTANHLPQSGHLSSFAQDTVACSSIDQALGLDGLLFEPPGVYCQADGHLSGFEATMLPSTGYNEQVNPPLTMLQVSDAPSTLSRPVASHIFSQEPGWNPPMNSFSCVAPTDRLSSPFLPYFPSEYPILSVHQPTYWDGAGSSIDHFNPYQPPTTTVPNSPTPFSGYNEILFTDTSLTL